MTANKTNDDSLLTKKQLSIKLGLTSTRGVDELMKRRKIPCVKLGHRTVRFKLDAVMAAIERLTIKEVA
jgi:predicted DNA-binding transcriptional regulator AlpA